MKSAFTVTIAALAMLGTLCLANIASSEYDADSGRHIVARDVESHSTVGDGVTSIKTGLMALHDVIDNHHAPTTSVHIKFVHATYSACEPNGGCEERYIHTGDFMTFVSGSPTWTMKDDSGTSATTSDTITKASLDDEKRISHHDVARPSSCGFSGIICSTSFDSTANNGVDDKFSAELRSVNTHEPAGTLFGRYAVKHRPCTPGGIFCAAANVADREND